MYDDYFQTFYVKRLEWYKDVLRKQPGNKRALDEIRQCKEILYKKWLIIIDDEPQKEKLTEQQLLFEE